MVGHKRVSVIYVVAVAMNAVDLIKFAGGPREKRTNKKNTHTFFCGVSFFMPFLGGY